MVFYKYLYTNIFVKTKDFLQLLYFSYSISHINIEINFKRFCGGIVIFFRVAEGYGTISLPKLPLITTNVYINYQR